MISIITENQTPLPSHVGVCRFAGSRRLRAIHVRACLETYRRLLRSSLRGPPTDEQYRLYTHIQQCENMLLSEPKWRGIPHQVGKGLRVQGLTDSMCDFIKAKLSDMFGDSTDDEISKMATNAWYTLTWTLGRLARVQDYHDVIAILDYITRVHMGRSVYDILFSALFKGADEAEAQSMDWSVLKDILSNYEALKTHPAIVKFTKMIGLAFSGGLFALLGVEGKAADLWKLVVEAIQHITSHTDFLAALFDLFQFLGERIAAFCVTRSWKSLLHTPRSYSQWADEAYDILEKSAAMANPSTIGMDYHSYVKTLADTITKGEEIKRYIRAAEDRDAISHLLSRLRTLHIDLLIKNACGKFRMSPFAMLISAGSSVGKSSFVDTLVTHYGKLFNKPLEDEFIYTRTASEEHWNNFKTSMWACILDDIASTNPNKGTEDNSLLDILQIVNNVPFSPPQAALEDKGRTPFLCELVVATTNTEDLKAHCWFNNPQAIRRRMPYVVNIVPKKEFRLGDTNMLDPSKVEAPMPGYYPDFWDITVKKVTVAPNELIEMHTILQTSNIYEFITAYNGWLDQHRHSQAGFMATKKASKEAKLCPVHRVPEMVCECELLAPLEPQSGEGELQGDDRPSLTSTLVKGAAVMATAYAGAKVAGFSKTCMAEALVDDPTLIEYPGNLIAETTGRMAQKVITKVHRVKAKLSNMPREAFKCMLRKAALEIYASCKPFLKKFLMVLGAATTIGITYSFLKKEFPEAVGLNVQTDIHTVGKTPTSRGDEIENVWRKDDYTASEFMTRLSRSWAEMPLNQVASIVGKNTVWCETTHGGNKHLRFRALCVSGRLYVVPNHVIPQDEYFTLQVVHETPTEGCNGNVTFKMSQACIHRMQDRELAFFEIKHMPVRRDLSDLLPHPEVRMDAPGRLITREADGSLRYNDCARAHIVREAFLQQLNVTTDICHMDVATDTMNGDCGSPVVIKQPSGCVIGGIHCLGGSQNKAVSIVVTLDDVNNARAALNSLHFVDTDSPDLRGKDFSTNISQRCTARYITEGTLQVYGSFGGFKRQPKCSVINTQMAPALVARGHTIKYGPAPMRGYTAVNIALTDMVQKKHLIKEDVLDICARSFADEIWEALPNKYRQELGEVLSLKSAINGVPGTRFLDSMNFNTSAGFPYNKSKRHFVTRVPGDEIWQDPVVLTAEMEEDIEVIWGKMMDGVRCAPVFMQHIKDEALPFSKIKAGKARIFMGGPFAWSVCVRMLFLPFIRVMQMNKYVFECAPGTNATSVEWQRLFEYLSEYGSHNGIAGDFKSFDKNMGALVILIAFSIIIDLCSRAGLDQMYLRAMQSVAEDTAFAFCNYNGDLMQFFGSNPSGHPLTVIINCLVNSLYMRYCYHEMSPHKDVRRFRLDIRLITYGDDNAMTSKVTWFNHTSLTLELAKIGITYTMADKGAESVPFIPIGQISFLKRVFRWEEELGAHVAPLDEDSIWKMLTVCVPSKSESHQRQCVDIVESAVGEWFFYGRERFNKEIPLLKAVVSESQLDAYVTDNTFRTWEELAQRFIKGSVDYLKQEPSSTRKLLGDCTWVVPESLKMA